MKLKKMVQILLIGCSVLTLAACSPKHHNKYGSGVLDADGAQAAGIGEDERFGGDIGGGSAGGCRTAKNTYYFDYDSNVVHSCDMPSIYANANYLLSHPRKRIALEGHTDPRGSREYNVALGERRAEAVAEILRSKGVNPAQIRVVSYGAERLAVPGHSERDFQLDRRVVVIYE